MLLNQSCSNSFQRPNQNESLQIFSATFAFQILSRQQKQRFCDSSNKGSCELFLSVLCQLKNGADFQDHHRGCLNFCLNFADPIFQVDFD